MGFKEFPFSEVKVFPEVNGEAISSVFVRLILWIGKLCHQTFYHVRYPRFIRYEWVTHDIYAVRYHGFYFVKDARTMPEVCEAMVMGFGKRKA